MAKSGRPTRAEVREQQMTDAFETMSKAIALQAGTLARLEKKLEGEPEKEQSRTIDASDEFAQVAMPAAEGEPGIIYKSGSRGLRQVVKKGYKIHTGDDYEIVPPMVVDFENSTYRTADPEVIAMLDAKIDFRKKRGLTPRIVKFKDEIAEALKDKSTEVVAIKSDKVNHDTPAEALIS